MHPAPLPRCRPPCSGVGCTSTFSDLCHMCFISFSYFRKEVDLFGIHTNCNLQGFHFPEVCGGICASRGETFADTGRATASMTSLTSATLFGLQQLDQTCIFIFRFFASPGHTQMGPGAYLGTGATCALGLLGPWAQATLLVV